MEEHYADILIRIHAYDAKARGYPVEATLSDGSEFSGEALKLARVAPKLRKAELDPVAYGLLLFEALFTGKIRRAYDKISGMAEAESGGRVRVRLQIDPGAAELHALPWERIYHPLGDQRVALAATGLTPFSRYTALGIPEPERVMAWPLRLLFAVANPAGMPFPTIDVESEVETLQQTLSNLRQAGRFHVTVMPGRTGISSDLCSRLPADVEVIKGPTTLENIQRLLPQCQVFHFLGHGSFERVGAQGEGVTTLHLEDDQGLWHHWTDAEIMDRVSKVTPLPSLVFLAACDTAKRPEQGENPFVGLGPKLVAAGVPAVIAMQDKLPMDLARRLTGDFYRLLLDQGVVDGALNVARSLIFQPEDFNWAIPVLFMRRKDGRLLQPNPIFTALQRLRADPDYRVFAGDQPYHEGQAYFVDLPVEAIHLTGKQDFRSFDPAETEQTAGRDVLSAMEELLGSVTDYSASRLLVMMGEYGSNITTQLKRTVWTTACKSLNSQADSLLPVYVDLAGFSMWQAKRRESILDLIVQGLVPAYWPEGTDEELARRIDKDRVRLRVLFDRSEKLTLDQREEAHRQIARFVRKHPGYQYVLAARPDGFDRQLFDEADVQLDILFMQRMERRKIRRFLQTPAYRSPPGSIPPTTRWDLGCWQVWTGRASTIWLAFPGSW